MSTRPASAPSPWSGVELLDRAIAYTRGSLAVVTEDLMSAPTPCAGWDLRALLMHMDDSLVSLHEAGSVRRVRVDVPPAAPDDIVVSLRTRACQLLAEWTADWATGAVGGESRDVLVDGRPVTSPVLTSAGALEVVVHGWDVAVSCGVPRPIPDDLAAALLRLSPVLVTDADRPARFGPELTAPPGASSGERLLAFLGRDPRP
ncbi:MAG TPA: TIGR03086 family metal-binding protein [Nocardioidaceae bacterium]|nr:TIGR03086 family metal-binding protein [Nocardioidaceae bacterium]